MMSEITLVLVLCGHLNAAECREVQVPAPPHVLTIDQCEREAIITMPQIMALFPGRVLERFHCAKGQEREA